VINARADQPRSPRSCSGGTPALGRPPLLRDLSLHWPIFMLSRPGIDLHATGFPVLALRLVLTLAAADLSFRFVETPIRRGGFVAAIHRISERAGRPRLRAASLVTALTAVVLVAGAQLASPHTSTTAVGRTHRPRRAAHDPDSPPVRKPPNPVGEQTDRRHR